MSQEDCEAAQMSQSKDGVPDLVLPDGWDCFVFVLSCARLVVLYYKKDLVDIHDAGANRCYEKHGKNCLEDIAHVCEATWKVIEILRQEFERNRLITFFNHDAYVISFDGE